MLVERYKGGGQWLLVSGGVGVLGLLVSLVGIFTSPKAALASYHAAFVYWVGIAVGGLIWLAAFHAAKAKWPTVLRRPIETIAGTLPLFIVLFIPILLGLKTIFPWVEPAAGASAEVLHQLEHKRPYLNVPFFVVRQVLYFGIWIISAELLRRWSARQDEVGGYEDLAKMRFLAPACIPFVGLSITFAGFDWLMSLEPGWFSTIFGAYYFAGSFLSAMAVLTLACLWATGKDQFGAHLTKHHRHNLGKFLLAFTAFWGYIGFSQFLLIWIANQSEETFFFMERMAGGWTGMSVFLIVGQFVLPFCILLGRTAKLNLRILTFAALWILFIHFIDVYWLVMPAFYKEAPHFSLWDLTSFVGVGGLAVAFGLFRLRGQFLVPVKDPYLAESLTYVQP